jgi:hypothetical protein
MPSMPRAGADIRTGARCVRMTGSTSGGWR